jgi:starch synthase
VAGADVVHSHTWYANLGGHLAALVHGVPHVATVHSLEPRRPWKAEQLGGGYALSSWCERVALEAADAVIAVSEGSRDDVLDAYPEIDPGRVEVIYNGIDTDRYRPDAGTDALRRLGVDPDRPSVVFVGRITRQKGVAHLLRAARDLDPSAQLVLCAGAPDTPEIAAEMQAAVVTAQAKRSGIVWIDKMVSTPEKIELYSHASVFCCPSIYEPFGIINLEAMACETAVVASAVGGIKEVVVPGETGLLVPLEQMTESPFEATHPEQFARALAGAINELMADPARCAAFGKAGRQRAEQIFSWRAIARQTHELYSQLVKTS